MQTAMPIHFWIDESAGIDRASEPVLSGTPLSRGALYGAGWFTLSRDDGASFLMEGTPAAYWPDGSVKWLHLCGAVDLRGGQRNRFTLSPAPSPQTTGLQTTAAHGGVTVTGGALTVRMTADPADVLHVTDADGASLLAAPGLSASLRLCDPERAMRPAIAWTFAPAEVGVVVRSAHRVVLRLPGQFVEGDRVVAELVLFVEVLRDARQLRLEPVFIYLGDPDRDLVAGLTLTVHSPLTGDDTRYGFANDRGPGCWDVLQPYEGGPRWPQARQVQLGSTFFRTEKRTCDDASWTKATEGQRSQGWCHLANARGGITAALRYCWQEYPHSLAINTEHGDLTFGLVPPETEPLDLRRYSPTIWGRAVYEYGETGTPFPQQWKGALGIAKASELLLHFHPADDNSAAAVGLAFAHPARLITDPDDLCAGGALGPIAPAQPETAVEQQLCHLADFLMQEREVRGWYGLMHYGDVQMSYYREWDRWGYDHGGYAWMNTESLPDLGLWLTALRHGRTDWLEAAITMTRHNRDIDMYHRGNFRGTGTRHNVNHWGCGDKEWRVSMPLVKRLHYYLTGDPWTREVILNTVEVYQSYDRTSNTAPSMSSALTGLLVKHELTGDTADLQALRNIADVYARAVREDGHFVKSLHVNIATGEGEPIADDTTMDGSYFFLYTFGAQHTLIEVADLLDHAELRQAIQRHIDLCLGLIGEPSTSAHPPNVFGALPFVACAWRWTGESRYRDALAKALTNPVPWAALEEIGGDGPLDEPRHLALNSTQRNKIVCSLGDLMHQYPYALAALSVPAFSATDQG